MFTGPSSMEEVKDVFAMNGDGAPSSHGFGDFFFQTYWNISIGDIFIVAGGGGGLGHVG